MKPVWIVFAALIVAAPASAAEDFAARILAAHNRVRAEVNVPPLSWDDGLAKEAAAWAQDLASSGKFEHSPAGQRTGEGENLWEGSAGGYTPEEMVGSWAKEKADFRNDTFRTGVIDGNQVGHYSQIVWRETKLVGCAVATGRGWDVLVCRYSPPGNWVGLKAYLPELPIIRPRVP